jgi:two-component system chemotaxis response regulator CheY
MARILIMDDEDSFRIALRQLLESWGHEVIEAHDGLEGLARYREAPMDLVITDTIMPGQDGLDTILALRREFQARAIVAMTGSQIAARDLLDLAKTMGAHRTLVKPLGWRSLYPLVWPALQQAVQDSWHRDRSVSKDPPPPCAYQRVSSALRPPHSPLRLPRLPLQLPAFLQVLQWEPRQGANHPAGVICVVTPDAARSSIFMIFLDHGLGALEDTAGDGQPNVPRGAQIDAEAQALRRLNGQLRRFGPFQDPDQQFGGLPAQVREVGPIRHQGALLREGGLMDDQGDSVVQGHANEEIRMRDDEA